jgi:hypothetical protein
MKTNKRLIWAGFLICGVLAFTCWLTFFLQTRRNEDRLNPNPQDRKKPFVTLRRSVGKNTLPAAIIPPVISTNVTSF